MIAWRYDKMDIKLKEENLSKDIPQLDLARNIDTNSEDYKSKNLIKLIDLNEFKSLKELLDSIHNTMLDSLKYIT